MTGRTYAARLAGREMRDTDAVFQQFYDGLRFPDYFGWNWDALSDCLRDLKWLSMDHCVLIVEDADEALPADPAGRRRLLFETLLRAGQRWSNTQRSEYVELTPGRATAVDIERGRLVVVLSCDAASIPSLQGQLRSIVEEMALS
ncbi:barstar family protein [Streptomyces luteireticuli]|uniref:barstar family protein n=1 Tax=Streptomyces luteireticuli TaxID=173858 RepID=UPI003558F1CE